MFNGHHCRIVGGCPDPCPCCQTSLTSQHNTRSAVFAMFLCSDNGKVQANFEGIQTLCVANSRLVKWIAACRASWCAPSTLSLPMPHPFGHILVLSQSVGIKDVFSSAEDDLVITVNSQALRWCFQQPQCAQIPTTLAQNLERVCQNCSKWTDQLQQHAAR